MKSPIKIISLLEKASGPDRDLDWQIAGIIYPWLAGKKWEPWTENEHDKIGARWFNDEENKWYPFAFELFTNSIDSALTLVPEGGCVQLFQRPTGWFARIKIRSRVFAPFETDRDDVLTVANGAIAVCIASLCARPATEGERNV